MARPRVFVSSTYYDLKNVRVSLATFISQMGYDATLNEAGGIAYGKSEPLDIYCYDEIRNCDIVLSIIGGRYGSSASDGRSSISQKELKTALDLGKQVYIFIDRNVLSEFGTFRKNKGSTVSWAHVDNAEIYNFIESLYDLPINNAIFSFDDSESIINILKEQWAGLFQRLMQERTLSSQITVAQELSQGLSTLKQVMANVFTNSSDLMPNVTELAAIQHPVYYRLKKLLDIKYRVFFISQQEMEDWLLSRSYSKVDRTRWDDPSVQEWFHKRFASSDEDHPILKINEIIFNEDGSLRAPDSCEWKDDYVKFVNYSPSTNTNSDIRPVDRGDSEQT